MMEKRDRSLLINLVVFGLYIGQFAVVAYLVRNDANMGWWMLVSGVGPLVILWLAMWIEEWLQGYRRYRR